MRKQSKKVCVLFYPSEKFLPYRAKMVQRSIPKVKYSMKKLKRRSIV